MRTSLVLLIAGAAAAGACVVGSTQAIQAQDAASARASSVEADTLKDVEIMRRVLVREALGARGGLTTVLRYSDTLTPSVGWAGGTSYGEGFVVPGQGATFILRTSDPVTAPSVADEPKAATPEPTAWDEESAALDGRPVRAARLVKGAGFEVAKVEALRNRVLDQLAKFGAKIRGLAPSDSLTVIVQGGAGRVVAAPVTANGAQQADAQAALLRVMLQPSTGSPEARTVLVIRATVADCKAAADGSLSPDAFRSRAAIASY
jgi:hypothetical protein